MAWANSFKRDEASGDAPERALKLQTTRRLANKEMDSFLIWVPQGNRVQAWSTIKAGARRVQFIFLIVPIKVSNSPGFHCCPGQNNRGEVEAVLRRWHYAGA
jgi:hypothetical protein